LSPATVLSVESSTSEQNIFPAQPVIGIMQPAVGSDERIVRFVTGLMKIRGQQKVGILGPTNKHSYSR